MSGRTPLDANISILSALTPRQRQVLALVANGHTNAQVGRRLDLSSMTINRHLAEIYRALGAKDRANAVALALLHGDLTREDINTPTPVRAARRTK
ncbi:helix-turn-helix transcriptional regulator [Streptomyces sp. NPDC058001]|uniref:helix-turn-helix domain-containing protein n=1 Tax=Streptomyces sp. NPDC058001 TaxID=3346300 RepID=UPI0036EEC024